MPERAYSVADVLDTTAGTTINHGAKTKENRIGGMLKDHKKVCIAAGFDENLYDQKPVYPESWSSLMQASLSACFRKLNLNFARAANHPEFDSGGGQ